MAINQKFNPKGGFVSFGIVVPQAASIGDYVWVDSNANGIQDSGESGKAGVTVELYYAFGGVASGAAVASTTTNASGAYSFTGLTPGDYVVKFIAADGSVLSATNAVADGIDSDAGAGGLTGVYTLASGENNTSVDAGFYQTASLGDRIWLDSNANGQQDDGVTGVSGLTVTLIGGGADGLINGVGETTATTTTGANGAYAFTGLTPGVQYQVQFSKPAGTVFTGANIGNDASDSDADALTAKSQIVTLASGENNTTLDAGYYATASLGDYVWVDSNANGIQDSGESGKSGVTVELYAAVGGVPSGAAVATATTGANGAYSFTDLAPGDYIVKFIAADGSVLSTSNAAADGVDSDAGAGGLTGVYTLASGDNNTSVDAGFYQTASLGDRIWLDSNANGQQDSGESGTSGLTVTLIGGGADGLINGVGDTTATTTTGANGAYAFTGLTPGVQYQVQFSKPAGMVFTGANVGNDASDSDADALTAKSQTVTLASGENNTTLDAGYYTTASLGDRIWEDKNANGQQDDGATGISGLTVTLIGGGADGLINGVGDTTATTTTGTDGLYSFTGLTPGVQYQVQFSKPAGSSYTVADTGNDVSDSDANVSTGKSQIVTLASGENNTTIDAGVVVTAQKASIGDRVWKDCDGDGIQDATETGVSGVTVKLLGADGSTVLQTTTTNSAGDYKFDNLAVGNYAIQVVTPSGYKVTGKDQGSNDAVDSDIDAVTGKTVVTSLVAGENDLSWDAGLIVPANCVQFNFNGNTATDGTDGNILSYTVNGVSVKASAFSRDDAGTWSKAYLGSYSGGLGVTDSSEGSGSGSSHTVDNNGRDNYVLFEFNQSVVVDKAYLGYVVNDSDMKVWIGTTNAPFTNHLTLTDAVLTGMGFTEVNTTTLTGARWADLNANGYVGNTLIIAADTTGSNDNFKIQHLNVCGPTCAAPKALIGDVVWEDKNYNGLQDSGEQGIANVDVKLLSSTGAVLQTVKTDSNGKYGFNVDAGSYKVQVVQPTGYNVTKANQGGNDGIDSDIDSSGVTGLVTVAAGQQDLTIDAGLYRKASIGDRVWEDSDHDGIQDSGEFSIANIKVSLLNSAGAVIASTVTNSTGNYKFTNLDPGTYSLSFDKANVLHNSYWGGTHNMNNWNWGIKDVSSNAYDNADSDVNNSGTNVSKAYTVQTFLESGENDMSWDAAITPIAIDLNGDGVQTVSRANSQGSFDLLGNGSAIASGWLSSEDGFLAIDNNANGKIDSISELFGGLGKGDGFAKLASFDSNGDGLVSAGDIDFASLKIWQDANGNHQTDAGELLSLADAGVASLKVAFIELPFIDGQGNLHLERSSATLADGSSTDMTDVYFNVAAEDAQAAGYNVASLASLLGNDPVWGV